MALKDIGTHDLNKPLFLSGNQAMARGAIEGGVAFVTGYPGTPSTYLIETLLQASNLGFRVEWSINEKWHSRLLQEFLGQDLEVLSR